ncbi:MAG: hypothetical protein AAB798_01980 [Patescibacteria group bacterium]
MKTTTATVPFTLRMEAMVKSRLEREAKIEDRSAAYIAQKAIRSYVDEKECIRAMVREVEIEADKGVFISSTAMDTWVRSWGAKRERPMPKPDIVPSRR